MPYLLLACATLWLILALMTIGADRLLDRG
jgi:hypothetical protein